jgi:hypothetical protein
MSNDNSPLAVGEQVNGFVNRGSGVQFSPPAPESQNQTSEAAPAESWRQVVGFPGYEVSEHGRVRRSSSGRVLRGRPTNHYLSVCLSVRGHVEQRLVHRLVAEAFLGAIPTGGQVDHVNGIKADNRAANLEIVTPGENTIRWWTRGGLTKSRGADGRFSRRGAQ